MLAEDMRLAGHRQAFITHGTGSSMNMMCLFSLPSTTNHMEGPDGGHIIQKGESMSLE